MRRNDRIITEDESLMIINNGKYGVLSTSDCSGNAYGIPLNYCFIDNCLYFHCALEGRKLKNIEDNPSVSFTIVGKTRVLPESFGIIYESVIITGHAQEVQTGEKQMALEGLLRKYSPGHMSSGMEYIDHLSNRTRVVKIDVDSISGKARRS